MLGFVSGARLCPEDQAQVFQTTVRYRPAAAGALPTAALRVRGGKSGFSPRRSIQPKTEDADQFLANGAAPFRRDPATPMLQITLASDPDEITADQCFPIHAIRAIDQEFILAWEALSPTALAGEDIDRLKIGILATTGGRNDNARVLTVREFTIECIPLLHRSAACAFKLASPHAASSANSSRCICL